MTNLESQYLTPFDPNLNKAIIDITRRVVGEFLVADTAPSSYEQLKAHLNVGKTLVVANEGSDNDL